MSYKTTTIVAPTTEPVSLAEAKAQLRLTDLFIADDDYIMALIPVARDRAEKYCNRFFTDQTISIIFDGGFTNLELRLPYPDLDSINELSYIDSDNTTVVIPDTEYSFDSERQLIILDESYGFSKSVRVEAITAAPAELSAIKQAILMLITDMYELRTETVVGASVALNQAVKMMLDSYRVEMGI